MRKCRVCGCTEHRACNPPCYWVEEDLCSACVEIKKCHICGAHDYHEAEKRFTDDEFDKLQEENKITSELVKCETCDEWTCSAETSETCAELLNYDQTFCTKCLSKQTKYDCSKCINKECDEEWSYCYDCPEYIEIEED